VFEAIVPKALITSWQEIIFSSDQRESGGLLLGMRRLGSLEIVSASYPMPKDTRTRTAFIRHDSGHADMAVTAWKDSGGTVDWIGEWHTHPFGSSKPSIVDLRNWKNLAAHTKHPMVFVIVGKSDIHYAVQAPRSAAPLDLHFLEAGVHEILVGTGCNGKTKDL